MRNFIVTLIVIGVLVYIGVLYANKVKSNPQASSDSSIDAAVDSSNQSNKVIVDNKLVMGDARHIYGDASAKVTIVEFSDFQCPYCKTAAPIAKGIIDKNPGKVKLIFRQFPLKMHQYAQYAAEAAEAVSAQNKDNFWKLHDLLFENQSSLSNEKIIELAGQLGINKDQFKSDLDSGKYANLVNTDYKDGQNIGIQGTPTFYVNGRTASYSNLEDIVKQELSK